MRQKHITLLGKCWNCTLPKQTSNLSALHAFFLNKLKTRPRFEDEEEDLLLDSLFCCFERFFLWKGCAMRITKRASWFDCFQLESSIVLVDLLLFLTSFTIGSINQSQSLCVILERGQIESVFSCQTNWVHPFSRSLISRLFVRFGTAKATGKRTKQKKRRKRKRAFWNWFFFFFFFLPVHFVLSLVKSMAAASAVAELWTIKPFIDFRTRQNNGAITAITADTSRSSATWLLRMSV